MNIVFILEYIFGITVKFLRSGYNKCEKPNDSK